jgi:hypothetical protein
MGTWIKVFEDGSTERGSDSKIANKLASWSQGRLSNIVSVQITDRMIQAVISAPKTDWHHFDRYEALISGPGVADSKRVARVVQAEVKSSHVGMYVCYNINDLKYLWVDIVNSPLLGEPTNPVETMIITEEDVGKWLSVCIGHGIGCKIFLGERGKFNGHKQIS